MVNKYCSSDDQVRYCVFLPVLCSTWSLDMKSSHCEKGDNGRGQGSDGSRWLAVWPPLKGNTESGGKSVSTSCVSTMFCSTLLTDSLIVLEQSESSWIEQNCPASPQIVHMGWTCECPEGSAAGKTSVFKFLALRGPYFSIFRSPPVIISSVGFPLYYTLLFSALVIPQRSGCSDESLSHWKVDLEKFSVAFQFQSLSWLFLTLSDSDLSFYNIHVWSLKNKMAIWILVCLIPSIWSILNVLSSVILPAFAIIFF